MKTIHDSANNQYTLAINYGGVKRVRSMLGIDLMTPYEGNPLIGGEKPVDMIAIVDVIYLLVKDDADRHGLTDEQWAAVMGPQQMDAAATAFYAEWTDFFRSLNRPDAATVIQKQLEIMRQAVQEATRRLEAIDPGKIVEAGFGSTSNVSAESSAATVNG